MRLSVCPYGEDPHPAFSWGEGVRLDGDTLLPPREAEQHSEYLFTQEDISFFQYKSSSLLARYWGGSYKMLRLLIGKHRGRYLLLTEFANFKFVFIIGGSKNQFTLHCRWFSSKFLSVLYYFVTFSQIRFRKTGRSLVSKFRRRRTQLRLFLHWFWVTFDKIVLIR